jgi:hypothetical protein
MKDTCSDSTLLSGCLGSQTKCILTGLQVKYRFKFLNALPEILLLLIGNLILINFRDLEGLTFRFFLQQFLPWFINGEFSTESLAYIDYGITGFIKINRCSFFYQHIYRRNLRDV